MSYAQELKATADAAVKQKESDPRHIAKNLYARAVNYCQSAAKNGLYSFNLVYEGTEWRRVLEVLSTRLQADGFNCIVNGSTLVINWTAPNDGTAVTEAE